MNQPDIRVLELRSVCGTGGGPDKTILLGASCPGSTRVATTVCYIRDLGDPVFAIDTRAAALGLDYCEVREHSSLDFRIWPALRRLVRDRNIDIVHAHDYKTDLLGLLLARAEGVIPLATAHGWTGHSLRERLVYYPVDRALLARYPRVVAVSGQIRDELLRAGAHRDAVTVVLNGIDSTAFHRDREQEPEARRMLQLEPTDFVIGAVGRLEPQKRFDLLIDVFARLKAARPNVRLLIAGDGGLRTQLETQIETLGVAGSCRLLGQSSRVGMLHHALNLFVQPSDYEGTSNAVLEAMAFETPIVATDAGGTREQIEHDVHGLIVPRGERALLQRAIEQVIADPAAAGARAAAARRRVEGPLSFSSRTKYVEAIYSELMTRSWARPRRVNERTVEPRRVAL